MIAQALSPIIIVILAWVAVVALCWLYVRLPTVLEWLAEKME